MLSRRLGWLYLVFLLTAGSGFQESVLAEERCLPADNNDYEKIFCELKRKGKGSTLPTLYEFRKNPPLTQAFLLKKPAERAGITLKIPERNNQETLERQEELLAIVSPPDVPAVMTPAQPIQMTAQPKQPTEIKKAPAIKKPVPAEVKIRADNPFSRCVLHQLVLQCGDEHYVLAGNKTNQQLDDQALSEDRKLGLPVYTGDPADVDAVEDYLKQAYRRYLEGMMEIGLAGSTMTYTKFANLYQYMVGQHLDFVGRFETMYVFLKKDKAAIGVSTRLAVAEDFNLDYCRQMESMIACDHQKTNYIFLKQDQ